MKNINKLIVPLFAMEGPDLSVKAAKLRNNIRHGKELDPVGKLPAGFAPDFAELQRMEADMGEDAFGALWAEFEHARKVRYKELCKRWGSKDYRGIVDYMDTPVDGPEEEPVGHE